MKQTRVLIDVWSDYVCPFCYLAEPALARIAEELAEQVEVKWHAFELRPDPVPTLDPGGEYLRDIWTRAVYPMAEQREMTLRLPPVQPRSRLALEAAEFAREQGTFNEMNRAIFRAFFETGKGIGDREMLLGIARDVGIDGDGLLLALERGEYHQPVIADEQLAHQLGLSGVPAMLLRREGELLEAATEIVGARRITCFDA
ncbi:MAG: DsbA family oxidoreductase, partial [Chthoniobacterales bacterium]|nr:DsbA family oxidoreductase [Chthoniobacterales bacterium]